MSERARVLLVDDSVVVRRAISDLLAAEPRVGEIVTASNGRLALDRLASERPDLIILDIEMPELDGIETLRALRQVDPSIPVLVFSALTERAGTLTLDALSLGARDYVTKPSTQGGPATSLERVRVELLAKVRGLIAKEPRPPPRPRAPTTLLPYAAPELPSGPIELVAIGASTGGPNALVELVSALPETLPVPVVITLHMPPVFTRLYAERLDRQSRLKVREAQGGEALRPGEVWLAPGDFHLEVTHEDGQRGLRIHQGPQENSCRPAVDVMFRSVAETYGNAALGVVLTGMGSDGQRGCAQLKACGSQVIVQDERTSVVWSMPGAVANAGLADEIVPLDRMAEVITRRVRAKRPARAGGAA